MGIGIATTQHIIYTSKNSKSIYHAAAPLHRIVRNIGAPTLSCQKAAWAMWNCQIILAFVWNCKSIYIALEMFSEKICILSELQESLVWMCMRCVQFPQFYSYYLTLLLYYTLLYIQFILYMYIVRKLNIIAFNCLIYYILYLYYIIYYYDYYILSEHSEYYIYYIE